MTSDPQPTRSQVTGDPAEDLYCLTCGYNLRGLSGDPRRCPECGNESSIEEMRTPAEVINKMAKKLETWPALMVGSLCLGFFLVMIIYTVLRFNDYGHEPALLRSIPPCVLLSLVGWIVCFLKFRQEAEPGSPWLHVVIQMHIASILILVGFGGTFGLCIAIIAFFFIGQFIPFVFLLAVGGWVPGYWLYRRARKNLLQVRMVKARQLAREEMKRRNLKRK